MSRLIIVRHAQASFFDSDYDKLSELGREQAAFLGKFWKRHGLEPSRLICGPRLRHRQTLELAAREVGSLWPELEIRDGLDEHKLDHLLGEPLPGLIERYPELREHSDRYRIAASPSEKLRGFQLLFEAVGKLWREAAPGTEATQSWKEYRQGVVKEIGDIMRNSGKNATIVVVTSVGGVTAVLAELISRSDEQAFELGWRIRNCSVTEFVFSGRKITLDAFNNLAHLPEKQHWTFR